MRDLSLGPQYCRPDRLPLQHGPSVPVPMSNVQTEESDGEYCVYQGEYAGRKTKTTSPPTRRLAKHVNRTQKTEIPQSIIFEVFIFHTLFTKGKTGHKDQRILEKPAIIAWTGPMTSDIQDESEIASLLRRDRFFRDTFRWPEFRDCWHPDSSKTLVDLTW